MSTPIIDHYVALHSFYRYGGQFPPVGNMKAAVGLVTAHRLKAELIGQWLYCYADDLVGVQLVSAGFWYSKKHSAYVYSGDHKQPKADDETLDEIRARLGHTELGAKAAA